VLVLKELGVEVGIPEPLLDLGYVGLLVLFGGFFLVRDRYGFGC
jgi:hypothetical protein